MARKFGGLFLSDFEWQRGKTAASVSFVRDAEQYIANCSDAYKISMLKKAVKKIKDGKLELYKGITAEEFIAKREREIIKNRNT